MGLSLDNDDEMGEMMTDACHMRAALLTAGDLPGLPADLLPSDDRAGMLNHSESMANEAKDVARGLGREFSVRLSHPVVSAPFADTNARRPSVAFRQGEVEILSKILDEVDTTASKRMKEGFNETSFTLGVLNSFFIFFCFGRYPEHFWLVYLIETMIFVPSKFVSMYKARPLCQIFYYFDLCWFLNFVAMAALVLFPIAHCLDVISISTELRKYIYLAAVGAGCGPLLGATAVLPFVAFLFHDYRTMTGLFIHLLPPMVIYTLLWNHEDIQEAWPNVFDLSYIENTEFFPQSGPIFLPGTGLGSVAGNGIALYFLWFVPYVMWMVSVGLDLPRASRRRKKRDGTSYPAMYDTVFHSTVRGGLAILIGKVCWGRPREVSIKQMENNDFELRDFLVYMLAHMLAAVSSIFVLAYPCFFSKQAHLCIIAGLIFLCTHRGSKRYTYYSTAMYGRMIRKNFDNLMAENAKSK